MTENDLKRRAFTIGAKILVACAIALALPAESLAQTSADDIRAKVKQGQKVSIIDDEGREYNGKVAELTGDDLRIVSRHNTAAIRYATIIRIDRPHDGLGNGARTGLLVGAAFGLVTLAMEDARACDPAVWFDCSDPSGAGYAIIGGIAGGLGAAIGAGIDALIHRDPTIYRRNATRIAVTPSISRRGHIGAGVQVSW